MSTDQAQDLSEQAPWNCDLGTLERDIAPVARDLPADLDELLAQRCEWPVLDRLRQRQGRYQVTEAIGQRMELQANRIVEEAMAEKLRPVDRVLTVLNSLLDCAALITEHRDPLSRSRQIGDDEAYPGV